MGDKDKLDRFAGVVAADLRDAEATIDRSLAQAGILLTTLTTGRMEAGLAAQTGHAALLRLGEAISAGISYRGQMVSLHRTLETAAGKLGANWNMGGPLESKPEDGTKHGTTGELLAVS